MPKPPIFILIITTFFTMNLAAQDIKLQPPAREIPLYEGIVPDDAPPLFIATAADDQIIPWKCATDLFSMWVNSGNKAELHIFKTGKHGFVKKGGGADHFMDRLEEWMSINEWIDSQQVNNNSIKSGREWYDTDGFPRI